MRFPPSGLGTREPPAGFYVQSGRASACRADRAAADRTCSRTVVSPDRVLDTSTPGGGGNKNKMTSNFRQCIKTGHGLSHMTHWIPRGVLAF